MGITKYRLPSKLNESVAIEISNWEKDKKTQRLWKKDATLWTGGSEAKWLGWLDIVQKQQSRLSEFAKIQGDFKGFEKVVLLGMGGSSLGPEVLAKTFGSKKGFPELLILDSTDPSQILHLEKNLNLKKTAFIVSSKSGSTLEPNIFLEYFYDRMKSKIGKNVGEHFFAMTDPGSAMELRAKELSFKRIFHGHSDIGGRYSVLSDFGIIPALSIGVDLKGFLGQALEMVQKCKSDVSSENPGVLLGIGLGVLAREGRDKITFIADDALKALPSWIEQLLAESTGKNGKGLLPFVEDSLEGGNYGEDRVFVYLRTKKAQPQIEGALIELEKAGHPIIEIETEDVYGLGQEFFCWELATAVAGEFIKVNPFDQPDVEASKTETRRLTSDFERLGELPDEIPIFEDENFQIYADQNNRGEILNSRPKDFSSTIKAHFARAKVGEYIALLAFVEMSEGHEEILSEIKGRLQKSTGVATSVGFGPRYLHSTGQAFKGGANSGLFVVLTTDHSKDVEIPNHRYTFGIVELAQGVGDYQVLVKRGRRVIRVHLKNTTSNLKLFKKALS